MASSGIKLLMVDDDEDDREIFQLALKSLSDTIEYRDVVNGCEALELFNAEGNYKPDIIFLDQNMPKMSGNECLKELRSFDRISHIPIYIYSTAPGIHDHNQLIAAGADGFITKPNSVEELAGILSDLLSDLKKSSSPSN